MAKPPEVKHILRWALPSTKPLYLETMSELGPVTTPRRKQAMVFGSKREAMLHPANRHPCCGFEPIPLEPER